MVDSACEIHLTDPKVVEKAGGLVSEPEGSLKIMAAGGHRLAHLGVARVGFEVEGGRKVHATFQVADIGKTFLSVARLTERGFAVLFKKMAGVFFELHGVKS